MKLAQKKISEEELVQKHLQKDLIKFSSPQVTFRGLKLRLCAYMVEQAEAMQVPIVVEDVPDYILNLFRGYEVILNRIKEVVTDALVLAGAKGIQIIEFNSQ